MEERRAALRAELAAILLDRREFVWEIGCGHGHFLTAYAQRHPDKCCIGIDLASERIDRATRKQARARLANLHFLQAEASLFLEAMPANVRISTLFILFPDPWPKLRHHKHRILQDGFLSAAAAHASADCLLCFRTDYLPYFDSARALTNSHDAWHVVADDWPFEHETVFQSRSATYHSFIARPLMAAAKSISAAVEKPAESN